MLKYILIGVIALVFLLVAVIASRPDTFHVERSTVIAADAKDIFPHINNLHKWDAWSPWAKMDPNATSTFSGPDEGVGATMAWAGNSDIGVGSMTISESNPPHSVVTQLTFIEPFAGEMTSTFRLEPSTAGTQVTWSADGKSNFIGKAMSLIIDCDTMIGGQYEKGLASLKSITEKK